VNESTRQERSRYSKRREKLEALSKLSLGELVLRYEKLFGAPTRTHNRQYLLKKLWWGMQESREGGLSDRAKARIKAIGAPEPKSWRWLNRTPDDDELADEATAAAEPEARAAPDEAPRPRDAQRDQRLPASGTVLRRVFKSKTYEVVVLDDGFALGGEHFSTLSAVACHIAGSSWNGFRFFGLTAVQGAESSSARGAR